jgi:hypothetical protein
MATNRSNRYRSRLLQNASAPAEEALLSFSHLHLLTRSPSYLHQPEFIKQQKISAKMHLTPLLLLAATLALTSKALPTGLNPTETSPSSTSKGMHRCCPPFKPRNKHFPPPRLPCDPNCTTGKKAVSFSIRSRGQTHVLACCSC